MSSANYQRIKTQALDIIARIPPGQVTTFTAIGEELQVPARHIAYILSRLSDDERSECSWQQVVPANPHPPNFVRLELSTEHRTWPSTPLSREREAES